MIKYIISSKSVKLPLGSAVEILDPANTWRIDKVVVGKYHFYILSHYLTLYTFVLPKLTDIAEVLESSDLRAVKCINRKLIGSMNNMKDIIEKFMRRSQGGDMIEIQDFVNRTPFGYLEWGTPDKRWEVFKRSGTVCNRRNMDIIATRNSP